LKKCNFMVELRATEIEFYYWENLSTWLKYKMKFITEYLKHMTTPCVQECFSLRYLPSFYLPQEISYAYGEGYWSIVNGRDSQEC
jgi:hypothetical protein